MSADINKIIAAPVVIQVAIGLITLRLTGKRTSFPNNFPLLDRNETRIELSPDVTTSTGTIN